MWKPNTLSGVTVCKKWMLIYNTETNFDRNLQKNDFCCKIWSSLFSGCTVCNPICIIMWHFSTVRQIKVNFKVFTAIILV